MNDAALGQLLLVFGVVAYVYYTLWALGMVRLRLAMSLCLPACFALSHFFLSCHAGIHRPGPRSPLLLSPPGVCPRPARVGLGSPRDGDRESNCVRDDDCGEEKVKAGRRGSRLTEGAPPAELAVC